MGLDMTPGEAECLTGILEQVSQLIPGGAPFELYALTVGKAVAAEPRLTRLLERATADLGGPQALALMRAGGAS